MERNQHNSVRYGAIVQPDTITDMVKAALRKSGFNINAVATNGSTEEVVDDGSVYLIRGEGSFQSPVDSERAYERKEFTYEIGYTHNSGERSFEKMQVTLWVDK